MGTCELFLSPEEISFRSCIQNANDDRCELLRLENCITGALLERQLVSLEPSRWKEGVRVVFIGLLRDALTVYSVQDEGGSFLVPIRKARVLLRCLEFAYRDSAVDAISSLGYSNVEEVATEIERLCTLQVGQISCFLPELNLKLVFCSRLRKIPL
jgi:separase